MIEFKLIKDPDPLLYRKLEDLDLTQDYDLEHIESEMIRLMNENRGIGISANQVNFDKRAIVIAPRDKEPFAMFNPKVLKVDTNEEIGQEGCLSFPHLYLSVKRPKNIVVEYIDKNRQSCIMLFTDIDSRCVQHELDHLDGICFTSKVSKLKLDLATKKQRKLQNGRTK